MLDPHFKKLDFFKGCEDLISPQKRTRYTAWLRIEYNKQEHLLPGDLSFFAKSGAQIQSNGKVAVASIQHAILLHHQLLTQCEFSIIKPPPLGDRFVELYRHFVLRHAN